jgi:hypothetical protein
MQLGLPANDAGEDLSSAADDRCGHLIARAFNA